MKSPAKLTLMFVPLLGALVLLFIAIADLKHPTVTRDLCQVSGTGPRVSQSAFPVQTLYDQGGPPQYDVGLHCQKLGRVRFNDPEPFKRSFEVGYPASVLHKTYQYLPDIWHIQVANLTADP